MAVHSPGRTSAGKPGQSGSKRPLLPALEWLSLHRLAVTRWFLVICQGATIVVTWRLWGVRTSPPMLPAIDLPQVPLGWPLLISLLTILRFPRIGGALHCLVVVYALILDQTRMQPEIMSMTLLLVAVSGPPSLLFIGRVHLLTLWGWAGLAKLLSENFITETGPWMFDGLFIQPPVVFRPIFGLVVIFLEMGAGLMGIFPDLRRFAAGMAVMVHAGALVVLGPLGRDWNSAIWPWNVALAICALLLIAPWSSGWKAEFASTSPTVGALAVLMVVYPALFYFGKADAYVTHHLYSADTSRGFICRGQGSCSSDSFRRTHEELNVPFPPEHRLFRGYFDQICRSGEVLRIVDRRRGPATPEPPRPCRRQTALP